MEMKKLYALLIILIVIYVGINVAANGLNILNTNDNTTNNTNNNNGDGITVGAGNFAKISNFKESKINNTAVNLVNSNSNMTILVEQLDSSQNVSDTANSLISQGSYTSNQKIDQNGVPAYFLYQESESSYNTDIYFAKDGQNFKISGDNITYENSESFINTCKNIIDTMSASSSDGKISRW